MRPVCSYTDFFVICSGGSERQLDAIADGVIESRLAMDQDPKAVELMFKLAARSRERWPTTEELPTAGSTPGLIAVE